MYSVKVTNAKAATSSFLERVEQDIEMRRELAARATHMKIENEEAQIRESKTKSRFWAKKSKAKSNGKANGGMRKSSAATRRAAQRASERRLSGSPRRASPRRMTVQSMEDDQYDEYSDQFSDGELSM